MKSFRGESGAKSSGNFGNLRGNGAKTKIIAFLAAISSPLMLAGCASGETPNPAPTETPISTETFCVYDGDGKIPANSPECETAQETNEARLLAIEALFKTIKNLEDGGIGEVNTISNNDKGYTIRDDDRKDNIYLTTPAQNGTENFILSSSSYSNEGSGVGFAENRLDTTFVITADESDKISDDGFL